MTDQSEPYFTTDTCTGCGAQVDGLHHRWACSACGTCSPYQEPPEGWQSEIGYAHTPPLPARLRVPIGSA